MPRFLCLFFALVLSALSASAQVAVNPVTNRVYLANEDSDTVSVINGATGATIATVPVGDRPIYIAVNPFNNRVYVNNTNAASLSVIDGATNAVATYNIGSTGPIAINPVTGKVYIVRFSSAAADEATIFDENTLNWYSVALDGFAPNALAVNTVANQLIVSAYASGEIRRIDASSTADHPPTTPIGVWSKPVAVAVNPVNGRVYSLQDDSRGPIAIITPDNEATFLTPSGHAVGPKAVAINPITNKIYTAFAGEVIVFDASSLAQTFIPSGTSSAGPVGLGINMLTNKVYVPNANGTLTIIDGATNATSTVSIPVGATGIAVNPITNRYYVSGPTGVTIVNGNAADARQSNPIATTITPLPSNTSATGSGSITLNASSSFSPSAPQILGVYYQLDGETGPWTRATGSGPYTAAFSGLSAGSHTIRAFAADSSIASNMNTQQQNTPLVGTIASYTFTVGGTPPANAVLALAQASYSIAEGGTQVQVQVNRTGGTTGAVSVTWATANGTAQAGSDFGTASSSTQPTGVLNWAAGDTAAKTITVPILNDTTNEPSETFTIALSNPSSGAELGSPSSATVTITDDDTVTPPANAVLAIAQASYSVSEGATQVQAQVNRTGGTTGAVSVTWNALNGTAQAGSDFGEASSLTTPTGVLSWAAGDTSAKTITVPILNDTTNEPSETFTIALSNPSSGAELGSPSSATVTITDDDPVTPPGSTFRFGAATITVGARGSNSTLQVIRDGPTTSAASVTFSTADGTAVQRSDYIATSGVLQFPAGVSTVTIAIGPVAAPAPSVRILANRSDELNETFGISLSSPSGATLGSPATATVTIAGATPPPAKVQFTAATASVSEGAGTLTLTATRTGDTSGAVSAGWSTADGTAHAGTEFGTPGNFERVFGTLNWAAGEGGSKTLTVPIINDNVAEGAKVFDVHFGLPVGAELGPIPKVDVTINDDDVGVAMGSATYSVAENAGTVVLQVVRTGDPRLSASVNWAAVNGSALAGRDYGTSATPPSGVLSWRSGDSAPKTITIAVINDALMEGNLEFTVELRTPTGTAIATPSSATVTILDDDTPAASRIGFDKKKYVEMEFNSPLILHVDRSAVAGGNTDAAASVDYTMVAGTALPGSDYVAASGTLNWGPGESGGKLISVTLLNDSIAESAEYFVVRLSNASPGASLGLAETTVLIVDDDEAFPYQGAFPDGWTTPAGAAAGWYVSNEPGAFEGAYSLRSDPVDDSQAASTQVSGNFSAGTVSFRFRVSSEANFDFLRFYVDGVKAGEWSGTANTAWQSFTTTIPAGAHTLRWSYEKDESASLGVDAAWIDAVVMPARTP